MLTRAPKSLFNIEKCVKNILKTCENVKKCVDFNKNTLNLVKNVLYYLIFLSFTCALRTFVLKHLLCYMTLKCPSFQKNKIIV